MAYEILTESYGRRLPKITAEADSTDDLATLGTNYAEGSTCVIGDKTYSLDKVQGWVEPGHGGGGGGGSATIVKITPDESWETFTADKTFAEITAACNAGACVILLDSGGGFYQQFSIVGFSADEVLCSSVSYGNVGEGTIPLVDIYLITITSDGIRFKNGEGKFASAT